MNIEQSNQSWKFNSLPESQEELEGGDDVGFEAGSGDGGREGGAGNDDDDDDDDDEEEEEEEERRLMTCGMWTI